MNTTYFDKLKELIRKKELEIFIIISPPRANSSLLELSLSITDEVGICHEPFNHARKDEFNPDEGYKNIYNSIKNTKTGTNFNKIVIKEMAQWIVINEECKKLLLLTNAPVLFLIRNPLLCIESRVKKVLHSLSLRPGLSLQQFLVKKLSTDTGFNFFDYLGNIRKVQNTRMRAFANEINYDISQIKTTPNLNIQNFLLDEYSQMSGFSSWSNLLDIKLEKENDFKFFTEILNVNIKRVAFEQDEFFGLYEIYKHCTKGHFECYIYDTTEVRLFPEHYIGDLCKKIGINFSEKMINWGDKGGNKFESGQNKKHEQIWYEKLVGSSSINLPTETPSNILNFPEFMQEYLVKLNFPIYIHMSRDKVTFKDLQQETITKMCSVDPVFSVVNNQSLLQSTEFIQQSVKYINEINMIKKINEENLEIKNEKKQEIIVEYIDQVDINNNIIGTTTAKIAHEQKLLHRVVGILLFDIHGNLYFQSGTKYNLLDLSVGGHVMKGEQYLDAAHREMEEELNLKTELTELTVFYPENAKFGHFWAVYEGVAPENWTFKPTKEVPDLVKMKYKDVLQKFENTPEIFTKGFLNVFAEYLKIKNK